MGRISLPLLSRGTSWSGARKLARETQAALLVFDLLADAKGADLTDRPLSERRERLEQFAAKYLRATPSIMLSPATRREKIKRKRTADCVVGGLRYATKGKIVGSLLVGRYDDHGVLHHVGFTSSLTADERKRITPRLEALAGGSGFTGRSPGGPSRWSRARSGEWVSLDPVLVVEVQYDHLTNGRFRHGTKFLRWRPEKAPAQCRLSQVAEARREAAATSREGGPPVAPQRKRLRSIGPRTARGTHIAPPRATRARHRSGRRRAPPSG